MLRRWRKKNGLGLREGARFLGLSIATLSDIERGLVFPSPQTISRILGATGGQIGAADHFAAWQRANRKEFSELRAAGRSAAKSFRKPAKRRK